VKSVKITIGKIFHIFLPVYKNNNKFLASTMSKAIALSPQSPEYKGISALNIIYEAGN
jgi:hypothetical protein